MYTHDYTLHVPNYPSRQVTQYPPITPRTSSSQIPQYPPISSITTSNQVPRYPLQLPFNPL